LHSLTGFFTFVHPAYAKASAGRRSSSLCPPFVGLWLASVHPVYAQSPLRKIGTETGFDRQAFIVKHTCSNIRDPQFNEQQGFN